MRWTLAVSLLVLFGCTATSDINRNGKFTSRELLLLDYAQQIGCFKTVAIFRDRRLLVIEDLHAVPVICENLSPVNSD